MGTAAWSRVPGQDRWRVQALQWHEGRQQVGVCEQVEVCEQASAGDRVRVCEKASIARAGEVGENGHDRYIVASDHLLCVGPPSDRSGWVVVHLISHHTFAPPHT